MFNLMKYFLNKIENYPKVTLEDSLNYVTKSKNRMICGKYSPSVFDMEFYELEYFSKDLKLYGWYIPKKGAKKTIIISHGRFNNRIFTIKYLQLFKDMNLTEDYNIFLPDLRNSGKSDRSRTAFGYYFSEDIKNAIIMLNEKYSTKDFVLYGFSQGAMGSALVPYLFEKELEMKNIKIEKIILDSPVSNVEKIILRNSVFMGIKIPYFIMFWVLKEFDCRINNNLENLKLSNILGKVPTLILQSEKDDVTPINIINDEYEIIKNKSVLDKKILKPIFKIFRKGQHVRIYLQYKWEYTQYIENFLNLS